MSKMLDRNTETRPPLLNLKLVQSSSIPAQANNKRPYVRSEYQSEPTSVLDIRSPSPTSTLSVSFGGSTDGGFFRENACDGQLLDCIGVMDSKDGGNWQLQNVIRNENEFQVAETEAVNVNPNVSMGMEYLENILLQSPEANNNSQIPCLMGEPCLMGNEYPLQGIKAEEAVLQHTHFNEATDSQLSEFFCGNSDIGPYSFFGDNAGHTISPFALNPTSTALFPPSNALITPNIHGPNPPPLSFTPDFKTFKVPLDEKHPELQLPYGPNPSYPEKNAVFPMPAAPRGHMGVTHEGFPEFEKSLHWQQIQQREFQPAWKTMINRSVRDPLFSPVKQEWPGRTHQGRVDLDEVQKSAILQQLLNATNYVELGSLDIVQAILARLNQYVSPRGKALQRATYYFKEALGGLRSLQQTNSKSYLSPLQLVHKINACKNFSEISPIPYFANFTANQVLLEALEAVDKIHIIDFDMGLGGQWASFLQEIALRPGGPPALRLTAVGYESMEMHLIRENLCTFAENLNIPFTFQVVEIPQNEDLNRSMLNLKEGETIAVNYSLGMQGLLSKDSIASILHLINRLRPKIVVVVDHENEQAGSSFAQKFMEALQFYALLFESLEAVHMNMETIEMIEKFVMAPRICNVVEAAYRRHREGENLPNWKSMFQAAGFTPMMMSNFTHKQAESLSRSRQQRFGFCFEAVKKQQEQILLLGWQRQILVSVSAWIVNNVV